MELAYGPWLAKFAASVSWRVLMYLRLEGSLASVPSNLSRLTEEALITWKKFLLGQSPNPSHFQQHMLLLNKIEHTADRDVPTNINRYILGSVEIDFAHDGTEGWVYAKMCRVILVGLVGIGDLRKWKATKLHMKSGTLGGSITAPRELYVYMKKRAINMQRTEKEI